MPKEKMAMGDQVVRDIKKNPSEEMKLAGKFLIEHIRDNMVIDTREVRNVITNTGKAEVAGLFIADTQGSLTAFDYIAIGTGTTGATASDTALGAEITTEGGQRRGGADVTGTVEGSDTGQLVTTFSFTSDFAVTESGAFNASSAGTMLCRQTFSEINVADGDSLQITWKVQVT